MNHMEQSPNVGIFNITVPQTTLITDVELHKFHVFALHKIRYIVWS